MKTSVYAPKKGKSNLNVKRMAIPKVEGDMLKLRLGRTDDQKV